MLDQFGPMKAKNKLLILATVQKLCEIQLKGRTLCKHFTSKALWIGLLSTTPKGNCGGVSLPSHLFSAAGMEPESASGSPYGSICLFWANIFTFQQTQGRVAPFTWTSAPILTHRYLRALKISSRYLYVYSYKVSLGKRHYYYQI